MQTVTFKVPAPLLAKLEKMADREDRSKSYLLRKAIDFYLQEMEEDEADYREAMARLKNPGGKPVTLEAYAKKHGLAVHSKR